MKNPALPFPFRTIVFWIVLFAVFRALFISILGLSKGEELSGWPSVFSYGLRLDLSASAYLTAIPGLLWLTGIWSGKSVIIRAAYRTNNLLLIPVLLILGGNLAVYSAWGTLINYRAVSFLADPEGIIASVSNLQLAAMVFAIFTVLLILVRLQNKFVHTAQTPALTTAKKWIFTLLTIGSLPLMMRGGLQVIPINGSSAWFSETMFLNDAATNPVWYLSDNCKRHLGQSSGEFKFMPDAEADSIFNQILPSPRKSTTPVLKAGTNIVLIVLESWTADIIEPLGGEPGVSPFFNSLCDSGLLFSSIYASGSRTDHMFPSVLAGLPALPNKSMVRFNDKLSRLPMLPKKLGSLGYQTLFFYGGELGFANMNTFLRHAGFKHISGADDYPSDLQTGNWGAADGPVLQRMLAELDKQKGSFFSMLLTLSTHEPFDVPGNTISSIGNEPDRFRHAARYTDRCLRDFFEAAKRKPWFPNTLFILVADHGHILPKRREYYDPETHRIPLLFTGPAIPSGWKGKVNHQDGGQHDLSRTLLAILGADSGEQPFSRNLLDTNTRSPAYINYEAGIGWKEENMQFVFLTDAKRILPEYSHFSTKVDSQTFLNRGKAYVQCLNSLFESY